MLRLLLWLGEKARPAAPVRCPHAPLACRGMGWTEGRAIGRGAKAEVVAKELVRRPDRLGLGATPAPETHQRKYIKPGGRWG